MEDRRALALAEHLENATACDDLYHGLLTRHAAIDDEQERIALQADLCQHAILRGDLATASDLARSLPRALALGYEAAIHFVRGDLPGAQRWLGGALALLKRSDRLGWGAVAPILALVRASVRDNAAQVEAKRLLAVCATDGQRGAARAFRTLLRYLGQPAENRKRLHVYQLGPRVGAWEILLSALTVHLCFPQPLPRAGFAQRLARNAISWQLAGYTWLARQAYLLASELSPEQTATEMQLQAFDATVLTRGARELSLWSLIEPKPEWERTLEALDRVSDTVSHAEVREQRAAWFIDMVDGRFGRPALQELGAPGGGFAQRRVSLSELYAVRDSLPEEDRAVLRCSVERRDGERSLTQEAYEALVGHPRVFNGARGQAAVEVVRGVCRVETEDDAGHIRLRVHPEGADLGINVAVESETRLTVYRVTEAMQRVMTILPRGARIPKAQEPQLLRVLAKLAQTIEVRSPELGAERRVDADATPCLRISPASGAWAVALGVRPFRGRGRFFFAGQGRPSVTLQENGQLLRCERDFALERARVDALIAHCPTLQPEADDDAPREDAETWILGEEAVLTLLAELRDAGSECALEWPESRPMRLSGSVGKMSLRGRLRVVKGWYLATGGVSIDDVTEVALNDLARAPALAKGRFLRLPDGAYLEVEERMRRVMAALRSGPLAGRSGAALRFHPGAVGALRELTSQEAGLQVDDEVRGWIERVERASRAEHELPAGLHAVLRPYQVEGFRWLRRLTELGLGACLSDDMGLGKTLQIIALLLTRTEGPALVVAPTSVCSNWLREIQRFAPSLRPCEYFGPEREEVLDALAEDRVGKVVIVSYALLQQDAQRLTAVPWRTAVLDEAQLIKNPDTLRARAAFRLRAEQRIAATGTPVENHLGDLWSIFHFLNPGLLGASDDFMRRFVRPGERSADPLPAGELRQMVRPYILRRLKHDVLPELPPVTEVTHEVRLSADDALRYALLRRRIHDKLFTPHGKKNNKLEVLAELTRLRRFCCHPRLVFPDANEESAKIQVFLDLVDELRENGHRALVFSQYVDFLSLVRDRLDERAVSYEYLDGAVPKAQRGRRVDAFQSGHATLFLISLKAGGFGLNLTAADYVIHLDPWWNPAVETQATDRAHRIGQTRPVTVYRLVTKDTIEEKIIALHGAKERLASDLLEGGELAGQLGMEDLVALISGDDA